MCKITLSTGREVDLSEIQLSFNNFISNVDKICRKYCENCGDYKKLDKKELDEVLKKIYDKTWNEVLK